MTHAIMEFAREVQGCPLQVEPRHTPMLGQGVPTLLRYKTFVQECM